MPHPSHKEQVQQREAKRSFEELLADEATPVEELLRAIGRELDEMPHQCDED